ncbi:hypothetical protein [Pseudoalteromonas luteoviolacea]|uniref:Uncharacterized protein n=1 Tax=Pseudoalteromonas luteoviolacea DSM 6061 TaxID=1365250 RepID=A0A166XQL3_9GAMM|nr:hypothetical protein [Pseudoalteromonas luteoviolacea]KZN40690.1 hypothetical protein N475_11215 [Pseudoalteromonas luteoviolacea DSM 6061]KZN55195.1 hypothetical protein N474_15940 [Pseudoalteromonas luteoviolacea CPMOR-2]MBE0387749.1 hypothetical protein [Pseudoalteromonas luteoviolacea DSM 6061]TQF72512.1 hypothetical protein FLM44_16325 [Pseudoalteromonas luteoviolacea]
MSISIVGVAVIAQLCYQPSEDLHRIKFERFGELGTAFSEARKEKKPVCIEVSKHEVAQLEAKQLLLAEPKALNSK